MAAASPQEWSGKQALMLHTGVTIKALSVSVRRLLARHLDPPQLIQTSNGIQRDWEGLAELFGYDYLDVESMKTREKTMTLLQDYSLKPEGTIGILLSRLEEMERYDVLEEQSFQSGLERSVSTYYQRQEENMRLMVPPEQVNDVTPSDAPVNDTLFDQYHNITIDEVKNEEPQMFDAFVCHADADLWFVHEMVAMLERMHNLKLCIPDRDVIPGCSKYDILAYLVQKRCKKLIVVLSPDYKKSQSCDFLTKFGQSLSPGAKMRKVIPILVRNPCPIPLILQPVAYLDFTKAELVEWFWGRLAFALQETPRLANSSQMEMMPPEPCQPHPSRSLETSVYQEESSPRPLPEPKKKMKMKLLKKKP